MTDEKKSGVVTKVMLSCPEILLEKAEEEILNEVREKTGYKLTRSKLIQALLEIAIEHKKNLNFNEVCDQTTLRRELVRSFQKKDK
jgi:metal-responsive CopG/Arc/MetJ family transcriptional regulator